MEGGIGHARLGEQFALDAGAFLTRRAGGLAGGGLLGGSRLFLGQCLGVFGLQSYNLIDEFLLFHASGTRDAEFFGNIDQFNMRFSF